MTPRTANVVSSRQGCPLFLKDLLSSTLVGSHLLGRYVSPCPSLEDLGFTVVDSERSNSWEGAESRPPRRWSRTRGRVTSTYY